MVTNGNILYILNVPRGGHVFYISVFCPPPLTVAAMLKFSIAAVTMIDGKTGKSLLKDNISLFRIYRNKARNKYANPTYISRPQFKCLIPRLYWYCIYFPKLMYTSGAWVLLSFTAFSLSDQMLLLDNLKSHDL